MIIFDLDTLADDTHRRHFIDHTKDEKVRWWHNPEYNNDGHIGNWTKNGLPWKPDIEAYNAACADDVPIQPIICNMRRHSQHENIQIWTGRCESTREMVIDWYDIHVASFAPKRWFESNLKMRPIGNTQPAWQLKEQWLDEYIDEKRINCINQCFPCPLPCYKCESLIDFVFDSDPESIAMWKRRGVFVFDCRQQ